MSAPSGGRTRHGGRARMFLRLLLQASLVQPGRMVSALLAVVVAASVATAMLNLYVDVDAKLRKEFRSYGANVVVAARAGQALPANALSEVESNLPPGSIAAPFAYAIARTSQGSPIVVVGADFDRVRKLDSWWSVTGWPQRPNSALIGMRAKSVVSPDNRPFELVFQGKKMTFSSAGTVRTGTEEDSRIYLSMADFTAWTSVQPSTIEIGVSGSTAEINRTITQLPKALPQAEVRPVRQIIEGEARVLGKTKAALAASSAVIILTAALCVLATLTTWVLDRRRDFAVMKALGASERLVSGFFAAQAAAIGAAGALLGYLIGIGVAEWIGRANFSANISVRPAILPGILVGSVLLALISAALPMSLLRRVQPATILRGE